MFPTFFVKLFTKISRIFLIKNNRHLLYAMDYKTLLLFLFIFSQRYSMVFNKKIKQTLLYVGIMKM